MLICYTLSSHELQSALMLTAEFSKMYYTTQIVPTLSLEHKKPVLETTILERYSEIGLSRKPFGIGRMYVFQLITFHTLTSIVPHELGVIYVTDHCSFTLCAIFDRLVISWFFF
jgi:hypothetical protein